MLGGLLGGNREVPCPLWQVCPPLSDAPFFLSPTILRGQEGVAYPGWDSLLRGFVARTGQICSKHQGHGTMHLPASSSVAAPPALTGPQSSQPQPNGFKETVIPCQAQARRGHAETSKLSWARLH